jgi:hypothetical protein
MADQGNTVVFLAGPQPVIDLCLHGAQTQTTIQILEIGIAELARVNSLTKIRLLDDLTHVGSFGFSAINETLFPKIISSYEYVAFYGQKGFVREATKLVVRAAVSFYKDKVKMFEDRDSALEWIQSVEAEERLPI